MTTDINREAFLELLKRSPPPTGADFPSWLNGVCVGWKGAIESPQIPKAVTVETQDKLDACLHALEFAYAHFGDFRGISNRFSIAGQQALSKMRDAIALATGRDAEAVQDDYCTRASKAEGGAPS